MKIGNKEFQWGERTYVMGVINMTPDSFSGDGLAQNIEAAVDLALAMQQDGADIIDVGGESTRPAGAVYGKGAESVSAEEELRRVLPVIRRLKEVLTIPVSIDTYKAEVARKAVAEGASLINDVWGLKRDPELAKVAVETGVALVVMHNQEGYAYGDLISEVLQGLRHSVEIALAAGVPEDHIIVDPGIGFGKTAEHNLEILRRLEYVKKELNRPLLLGASRKSFIGTVLGGLPPDERVEGTAATLAIAIAKGADMVRVHDVKQMARVCRMSDAIVRGWIADD
ncbi:MAG: dihydropteroate synthase [Candidatus Sungbacteria bacterium]|nr:dihydropteroate synthase [Candidatus Sungbacteria bacterium]